MVLFGALASSSVKNSALAGLSFGGGVVIKMTRIVLDFPIITPLLSKTTSEFEDSRSIFATCLHQEVGCSMAILDRKQYSRYMSCVQWSNLLYIARARHVYVISFARVRVTPGFTLPWEYAEHLTQLQVLSKKICGRIRHLKLRRSNALSSAVIRVARWQL